MADSQQDSPKEGPKVKAFREELIKVCEKHKMNVIPTIGKYGPIFEFVSTEETDGGTEHPKE